MTATVPTLRRTSSYIEFFPRIALSERPFTPAVYRPDRPGRIIAVQVPVAKASIPLDNKLLASLPRDHFDRLLPHLSTVSLQQGVVLFEAGDEVDQVYFPHYGMLSLLAVLRAGVLQQDRRQPFPHRRRRQRGHSQSLHPLQ